MRNRQSGGNSRGLNGPELLRRIKDTNRNVLFTSKVFMCTVFYFFYTHCFRYLCTKILLSRLLVPENR